MVIPNKKNNIFKVVDSTDKDAEPITVEVKKYIPKVVITIGYVGYLLTATESIEGLIILGLAVLYHPLHSCGAFEERTTG